MLKKLRIVYFGSSGDLSLEPLKALLKSPHEILAVIVTESTSNRFQIRLIPIDQEDNIESIALKHDIQILKFNHDLDVLKADIEFLSADLIVTSCFSQKIPESILSIPKIASINLHPSLLPLYRGPDPLFWQIRDGVKETGVTIHLMDNNFDSGNIVAQQRFDVEPSLKMLDLKKKMALESAKLLINTLNDTCFYIESSKPQSTNKLSYQSFPEITDFTILDSWNAKRVFDFMKATDGFTRYYPIQIEGKPYRLLRAIEFNESENIGIFIDKNKIMFPCKKGYVTAEFDTSFEVQFL